MTDYSEYETKCRNAHDKNFLANTPSDFRDLFFKVRDFTMLSRERLYDLYVSINHVIRQSIPGDIVEVGCWGGGALAVALACVESAPGRYRAVWGYDTFEGHPEPSADEFDVWGKNQLRRFREISAHGEGWCKVDIDQVRRNIASVCKSTESLHLVKGRAEESLKLASPEVVSVLRIDVDWYEPSLESLLVLYPRLARGGVLIIDDYGHHSGSRKAFDEFFGLTPPKITHIDYSCITMVKP